MARKQVRRLARVALALVVCLAVVVTARPAGAQGMGMGGAVATTATTGAGAELMKFAPEGVWAAGAVDVKPVMAAPLLAPLQMADPEAAMRAQSFEGAAFFMLPMDPPLDNYDGPQWCGLIRVGEGMRPMLEAEMADEPQAESVGGLTVYEADAGLVAFIDDTTMVMGGDAAQLGTIINSYRSGPGAGVSSDLAAMLAPHAGRVLSGGVAFPVPMRQMISPEEAQDMPPWLGGLNGAGLGADITTELVMRLQMKFTDASEAQQMLMQAQTGVAGAREFVNGMTQGQPAMAANMAPILGVFDKLQMTTEGDEFRASLDLTQQDMQALQGAIMMSMMMFAQPGMAPGGPGMPAGPGPGM